MGGHGLNLWHTWQKGCPPCISEMQPPLGWNISVVSQYQYKAALLDKT